MKSRGAPIWWVRSTTATSLALAVLAGPAGLMSASPALAGGADRLLREAVEAAGLGERSASEIATACDGDPLCTAHAIADVLGPKVRVLTVDHPESDTIRLAETAPSLTGSAPVGVGGLRLRLDHFGRKAEWEIGAAVLGAGPHVTRIELDLRGNAGGDFGRMLRVAALFTGPRNDALYIDSAEGRESHAIPAPVLALPPRALIVLIGPGTASSAEVLAALLRRHAGARLLGERTRGKDWLLRLVAVDHDHRLALPVGTLHIPDENLGNGVRPDGPVTDTLKPDS